MRTLLGLFLFSNIFASHGAFSEESKWEQDLRARLEKAVKKSGLEKSLGILVTYDDGAPKHEIYALNPDRLMIPASVTKILTAGAVISSLGPGKKFETQLRSSASISGSSLKGDLCLVGGGDPGFVSETMWFLVNEFVRTGIKKIEGSVLVDDSRFDSVRSDSSRTPDRVDRAYDAPIGAMSFNWNSVNVFVRAGKSSGDPAQVFVDPENSYIKLVNQAKTSKPGSKSRIAVSRSGTSVHVSGNIALGSPEVVSYKNISEPDIWSGQNLVSFLSQRGISVSSGQVKRGICPKSSSLLARAEGKPVGQIIHDLMKFSNNFVAEMMAKNLAAEAGESSAKMETGVEEIRKFVVKSGVPRDQFKLVNPSGLSRENQFKPRHLLEVLHAMSKDFSSFAEALSSYPISGIDGTLKNRNKGPASGWIRAKTGMLNGVSGLAGYAGRKDGRILTFVFLFNGSDGNKVEAMGLFDRLSAELVF